MCWNGGLRTFSGDLEICWKLACVRACSVQKCQSHCRGMDLRSQTNGRSSRQRNSSKNPVWWLSGRKVWRIDACSIKHGFENYNGKEYYQTIDWWAPATMPFYQDGTHNGNQCMKYAMNLHLHRINFKYCSWHINLAFKGRLNSEQIYRKRGWNFLNISTL